MPPIMAKALSIPYVSCFEVTKFGLYRKSNTF